MPVKPDDLHTRLRVAADAERATRSEALSALLDEASRLEAWRRAGLPADLVAYLGERREALGLEVLDLLMGWVALGGRVSFDDVEVACRARPQPEQGGASRDPEPAPPPRLERDPVQAAPAAVIAPPAATPVEPPAPTPRAPAAPPASELALASLKDHLEGGGRFDTTNFETPDWRPMLVALVATLAPGRDDEAELDRVHRVVGECQSWVAMPADVQRGLIAHLAARLRTLQEHGVRDRRIDQSFLTLTAYSARERPGFVMGLNRTHRPSRASWAEDADAYFDRLLSFMPTDAAPSPNHERLLANIEKLAREIDLAPEAARSAVASQTIREIRSALDAGISGRDPRLVRIATPFAEQLNGREFRLLRRAIRDEIEAASEATEEEPMPDVRLVPEEWDWWNRTRGRRALMVGGSPREPNRQRLERAFEFESLEWVPAEHRRNSLISVRNRVRAGGVDIVLILRSFVGHDADEVILPACRETGLDWVHVDQGYGVVRVRQAIERFLDPASAVTS